MTHWNVKIKFNKKQTPTLIRKLAIELSKKGITFDSGTDFKIRDWELDWSLKGAKPSEVFKFLDEKGIVYTKERTKKTQKV